MATASPSPAAASPAAAEAYLGGGIAVTELNWRQRMSSVFAPQRSSGSFVTAEGSIVDTLGHQISQLVTRASQSSGDLLTSVLKPSDLKKFRDDARGRARGGGGGGGTDVLKEIKQLRANLEQQERAAERHEREKRQKLFRDVLDEILQTEANYIADVRYACAELMAPLAELVDAETTSAIFANLPQISMMHQTVEQELAPARQDGASTAVVGESILAAFLKLLPFFKMYNVYCASYTKADKAIAAAAEKKGARAILDKAVREAAPLEALLFRPVQRMCVYPLLFRELLKMESKAGA